MRLLAMLRNRSRAFAWRAAAIAVVIGAIVVLLPRHARQQGTKVPSDAASAAASGRTQLTVPDFRLTAAAFAAGQEFVLSQHAQQPTIIYAMASWCGSCMPQAQTLVRLKQELGDRVNLVIVDIDPNDTEANLRGIARAAGGPQGFWAVDLTGSVTRPYEARWLHTMILIGDGREAWRGLQERSLADLRGRFAG